MGNDDWWCLKGTSLNLVKASERLSTLIINYPISRLANYFKALSHPTRILIISLMLDGRPYTKEDMFTVVSKFGVRTTLMSIDRHFRTLESYGVIRPYAPVRRECRGRRPYAYVISEDAAKFFAPLLTYLIGNPYLKELRSGGYVVSRLCIGLVRRAKLVSYLSNSFSNYVVNLMKYLVSRVSDELLPYVMTKIPANPLRRCSEALDFLLFISKTPYMDLIPRERLVRIVEAAKVSTTSPSSCVPELGKSLSKEEFISELIERVRESRSCCDFLLGIANSVRTYVVSVK